VKKNTNLLEDARKSAGLTRGAFAAAIGVAENYIYLVESGRKPYSPKLQAKVERWRTAQPKPNFSSPAASIENSGNQEAPPAVSAFLSSKSSSAAATGACHYPADCDLPAQMNALRDDLDEIKSQMRTLLGLLGPPLREAVKRKAV
jgi:DNA-binding XRE family transcriptional regulator